MTLPSTKRLCLVALVSLSALAGCASTDIGNELGAGAGGVEGNWGYVITNASSATFTGCTGQAAVLEGVSYSAAAAIAPICGVAVEFDVTQADSDFQVVPHSVTCSDGSTASVAGLGQLIAAEVAGQWETASDQGVNAVQVFSGVVTGNLIRIIESRRTFSGAFDGACDLSPSLEATVYVE